MTASAGAWYRVGKVNVTNDNQSVTGLNTNWQSDVVAIAIGDIFTLDAKTWYEVTAVNSDTSITIDRPFEGATGSNKSYAIVRNTSGTILTRIAGQVSVQFNQKQLFLDELRTWLNSTNASEELTDSHGLKQSLKTPSQMVRDHDNKLAELDAIHPHPWAMRKVEFEARRAANREKFAASGFVHKGKVNSYHSKVGEGLQVSKDGDKSELINGSIALGFTGDPSFVSGASKEDLSFVNIAGVISKLDYLGDNVRYGLIVKLPPAEDGTRTYDSATGLSVKHATAAIAFASETDTNKVVTERVDMWGLEAFLREINDADPFVYKHGLIQSLATEINGVPTVSDNVRPITYFAWYEGDEDSRGKGVNWQTASESQRIVIASDPENNIFFDDATGKFYQWCIRGRSFAGIGNGDWDTVDASHTANLTLRQQAVGTIQRIPPQGILSSAPPSGEGSNYYSNTASEYNPDPKRGLFTSRSNSTSAARFAYFLVCGTVNRLNQGAYHPSLNPLGANGWRRGGGDSNTVYWYEANILPWVHGETTLSCFAALPSGSEDSGGGSYGGKIGQVSKRPDDRFHDAIYASGAGGVCRDMRYSAWGLTPEDFAEADLAVKSGEYRGVELLKSTEIVETIHQESTSEYIWLDKSINPPNVSEKLFLKNSGGTWDAYLVVSVGNLPDRWDVRLNKSRTRYTNELVVLQIEKGTSIAAEYTHTEVIGDPADILQCNELKNGWVGTWNPRIPDGILAWHNFTLSKPSRKSTAKARFTTDDSGESWITDIGLIDPAINAPNFVSSPPVGRVEIWTYTTKARVTKNTINSVVHQGVKGFGEVYQQAGYYTEVWGSNLLYSLINKIAVSSKPGTGGSLLTLESLTLRFDTGKINDGVVVDYTSHPSLSVPTPSNNSPGFKALNYNVVENQQGFINYAYTELKHNGTDWGDDGKIHIADNQATRLDDNGNTVVYGTARIVEPLGWIKNDK